MPHLFSGLNQKRQSGKITNGTQFVGSKGRGSVSRMVTHCKSNSENPSDCVNSVLNLEKPKPKVEPKVEQAFNSNANILFDISSFSKLFDLDGSGNSYENDEGVDVIGYYRKIDVKYIEALTNAANRWNTYIRYSSQMNQLMYNTVKGYSGAVWKGIELDNCQYKITTDMLASAAAYTFEGTTINYRFLLRINTTAIQNYDMNTLTDLFTHEFGHVLGMPCWRVIDGTGEEVLPLSDFVDGVNSKCYIGNLTGLTGLSADQGEFFTFPVFPKALVAYNTYGAFKVISQKPLFLNNIIPLNNNHTNSKQNYKHWSDEAIIDSTSSPDYHFIYHGLPNEILNPYISEFDRSIISLITIKELTDIYTLSGDTKVYNYTEINPDASEVTGKTIDTDNYTVTFIGNPPSYTKSFSANEIDLNGLNNTSKSLQNKNRIRLNCDCEPICIEIKK